MPPLPALPESPTVRALLAAGAAAWAGITALALALGNPASVVVPCSLALVLILATILLAFARNELRRLQDHRQLEAYIALVTALRPEVPLPATRGWAASPDLLKKVADIVLERGPRLTVEASSGTSTIVIALCLRRLGRGRVIALEHDAAYAERTRRALALHGLSEIAQVVHAPLVPCVADGRDHTWYDLRALPADTGTIDLLVVDGPPGALQKQARYPAVPLLIDRLSPDAVIVMDDGARPDEQATVAEWSRRHGLQPHYLDLEKGAYVIGRAQPGHLI